MPEKIPEFGAEPRLCHGNKLRHLRGESGMETDKFVQSKVIQMPIDELKMAQPFCEVFEIRETDLRQVMDAIISRQINSKRVFL